MNIRPNIFYDYYNSKLSLDDEYTNDEVLLIATMNMYNLYELSSVLFELINNYHGGQLIPNKIFSRFGLYLNDISGELINYITNYFTSSDSWKYMSEKDISLHGIIYNELKHSIYVIKCDGQILAQLNEIKYCDQQHTYYVNDSGMDGYVGKQYLFIEPTLGNNTIQQYIFDSSKKAISMEQNIHAIASFTNVYQFNNISEAKKARKIFLNAPNLFGQLYCEYECKDYNY